MFKSVNSIHLTFNSRMMAGSSYFNQNQDVV